jgi:hypothetical protein
MFKGKRKIWTIKVVQMSFTLCFLHLFFISCLQTKGSSNEAWKLVYQPRQRVVKSIALKDEQMFIGTGNGVKVSKDKGKTWKDFGTKDLEKDENGNALVNWIEIYEDKIYIATSFGAYESSLEKAKWEKVFERAKSDSFNINSVFVDNNKKYFCSNDGLWICNGGNCERSNKGLEPNIESGNYEALFILKNGEDLYLSTSNGVYKLNSIDQSWEDRSDGISRLPDNRTNCRHLLIDNRNNLLAACGRGIYKYEENSWENISQGIKENIDGFNEAYYLLEDKNNLYAATASGIFELKDDFWNELAGGIRTKENNKNVYFLNSSNETIYAATDEGLFGLGQEKPSTLVLKGEIEKSFTYLQELEPSAIEVQKQALKFSSLPTSHDFKRYRTQARLRNIVPRVSFDLNSTDTNSNYSELQKGISTDISLDNKFNSDKTLQLQRDGRNYKQVSVFWNTDQLIYDDEINNVLSQARLTANIKENLLDDITRIYFQRRKAQLENLYLENLSVNEKIKRDLEIAELTSQIDSRTGGWFTKEIEKRKKYLARYEKK